MFAKIFTIVIVAGAIAWAQAPRPVQQAPQPVQQAPQPGQAGAAGQSAPRSVQARPAPQTFDSPDAAVQALLDAASKNDTAALKALLGSSAKGILTSGDPQQDQSERQEFAQIANAKHRLERSAINSHVRILVIGDQEWPFPIPLMETGHKWHFDSERGAYEMKAREIGANELAAIEACAAYVGVQQEYAMKKRSPAGTLEYAESVAASPVPKEFAEAAGPNPTRPYHGYYFRVLHEQGPNAPGGQHSYKLGKAMIGGFALVAWPATYGVTGIHTFMVNQEGVVYEKDRGPARSATPGASYDPDPTWTPVE